MHGSHRAFPKSSLEGRTSRTTSTYCPCAPKQVSWTMAAVGSTMLVKDVQHASDFSGVAGAKAGAELWRVRVSMDAETMAFMAGSKGVEVL